MIAQPVWIAECEKPWGRVHSLGVSAFDITLLRGVKWQELTTLEIDAC